MEVKAIDPFQQLNKKLNTENEQITKKDFYVAISLFLLAKKDLSLDDAISTSIKMADDIIDRISK